MWISTRNLRTGQKLNKLVQRQIELTTRSTEQKSKTKCEVTWNTWGTCERSWCQGMSHHALKILRFRCLSFCCQLLSLSFDCFPWEMHAHCGSSLSLRSSHSHLHGACVSWAFSLTLLDFSSHFISCLFISPSPCCSCCLTPSTCLMSWITSPRTSAEELGTLAKKLLHRVSAPTTTSLQRRMSSSPRSP